MTKFLGNGAVTHLAQIILQVPQPRRQRGGVNRRSANIRQRVNGRAVLSTEPAERERCADARRVPALVIRVTVQASYLHCARALMRSALWDVGRHVDRTVMPSMAEMLRDQIGHRMSPDTVFENQAQALERYRLTL